MSETGLHEAIVALRVFQEPINQAVAATHEATMSSSSGEPGDVVYETDVIVANLARSPGKRLRGALVVAAYQGCGGTDLEVALGAAVAVEENQNSLLAFDDFMDRSETRRGQPTPHVHWDDYIRKTHDLDRNTDVSHLANSQAVNTAIKITYRSLGSFLDIPHVPAPKILEVLRIHAANMDHTSNGQARDLDNPLNEGLTEALIEQTYIDKTAYYTFINPMQIGACLAGADTRTMADFESLGKHMGLAYQYKDDLLAMFGDPRQTGKPVFEDLEEGKMTLLLHFVLNNASEEDKLAITALRGQHITVAQQPVVRRILQRRHGPDAMSAERYVEEKAQDSVEAARAIIDGHPEWKPEFAGFLRKLLSYIILRDS